MKTKNNFLTIVTTLLCLLPILLGVVLYEKLPADIPIHFNSAGEIDNYLSKPIAVVGFPLLLAAFNLFMHFALDNDPKKKNTSNTMKAIGKWTFPVISLLAIPLSFYLALGNSFPVDIVIPSTVGILLIICGNYLPKTRQNYTIGIKIPWTLHDENNWNRTHRLAGFLWIVGGLIIVISSLLQFHSIFIVIFTITLLVVIPFAYSYVLYKQNSSSHQ